MSIQIEEKSYPKKLIAIVISVILILTMIITSVFVFTDISGIKNGYTVTINEGMSFSAVTQTLKNDGIIRFPAVFKIISKCMGADTKIRPGIAELTPGMTYKEVIHALTVAVPEKVKVTIPEGLEAKEIAEKLSELVSADEFNKAMQLEYDYKFLENLPKREVPLEGYLFPATYEFEKGVTAEFIINEMLSTFNNHFPEEYYKRAEEINMTVDQIVTLASIIERESNSGEERPKVAGVFYNRLKMNMRLQSCATVQYILSERKSVLSTEDTKIDSPYNTYRNDGLPIGPIASPGDECIKAALFPDETTTALYFVLGPDGKHIFSDTFNEHIKAKNGR